MDSKGSLLLTKLPPKINSTKASNINHEVEGGIFNISSMNHSLQEILKKRYYSKTEDEK